MFKWILFFAVGDFVNQRTSQPLIMTKFAESYAEKDNLLSETVTEALKGDQTSAKKINPFSKAAKGVNS